jgi:hypothetical protein
MQEVYMQNVVVIHRSLIKEGLWNNASVRTTPNIGVQRGKFFEFYISYSFESSNDSKNSK